MSRLSPALRVLATLASAELDAHEIRFVLGLSDTAYRKRLSDLRHAVQEATAAGIAIVHRLDSVAERLVQQGVQVLTPVTEAPGGWSFEFNDPDAHPLAFFQEESKPRRA